MWGPMVERCRSKLGPEPGLPDRMSFDAVLDWARTAVPWRDLPAEFGACDAVDDRLCRWIHAGRIKQPIELMVERAECEDARRLMIDSTVVRARQHAAGAGRAKGGPRHRPSAGRAAASRRR